MGAPFFVDMIAAGPVMIDDDRFRVSDALIKMMESFTHNA